jgi:uncharacterized protein YecE (DUF72 family)
MTDSRPCASLRIGTSGWSYPSGRGAWTGVFYPSSRPGRGPGSSWRARPDFALEPPDPSPSARGKLDELAFYAEHFDTVEVNSTFYRVPSPQTTASWARRTPAGFEFSVKLFHALTHPPGRIGARAGIDRASPVGRAQGRGGSRSTGEVPDPDRRDQGDPHESRDRIEATTADVDAMKRALDPLASAGKLGALLVQFPASFTCDPWSEQHLEWLLAAFRGFQVAVELRHRTWSDRLATTLGLLNGFGAAWAQIDEPKFRSSIRQNYLPNVTAFYYLRLHGRNAAQWWSPDAPEDRYNYLYSSDELEPFAETATAARRLVRKLYLYMNNHFEAKAVANAVMLKQRLGEPIAGEYPESFVARFPELRGIVRTVPASSPTLPLSFR